MNNLIIYLLNFRDWFFGFFAPYLGFIKFFAAIISIILAAGIVYSIVKLNLINTKIENYMDVLKVGNLSRRKSIRAWIKIKKQLRSGESKEIKAALAAADKLLDELLNLGGYQGKTMDERLKLVEAPQLSNINDVWSAHKLCQRLKAEPEFPLTEKEAALIIGIYKKSFQEWGLID